MNWFQRLRRYIIIKTAENYYNNMMRDCNDLYKKTKQHHYIIVDPISGNKITITNRQHHRAVKRAINDSSIRLSVHSGELALSKETMLDIHEGCFYSSLLQSKLDKLLRHPEENRQAIRHLSNDIEARRRAYIKWTLEHAKIRHRKTRKERQEERIVRKELKSLKRQ